MAETINPNSMVRLHNDGLRVFRKEYDSQWYVVKPGADKLVPYFAGVMWLGDPRSVNIGTREQDQHRTKEVRRLSTYYGTLGDPWYMENGEPVRYTSTGGEKDHNGAPVVGTPYTDNRHPNLPHLSMWSLDDDTRFTTVIDDPEGDKVTPISTTLSTQRQLEDTVQTMARNMEALMDELKAQNPDAAARVATRIGGTVRNDDPLGIVVMADPEDGTVFDTDDDVTDPATSSTLDDIPVEDVAAVVDVPPAQRPRTKAGARAQAAAQQEVDA